MKYKRILLKLSGEALKESNPNSIFGEESFKHILKAITLLHNNGIEIAIVVGAGNIYRGKMAAELGLERIPADFMGMLGTMINAISIASALRNNGIESVVYSPISPIEGVVKLYDKDDAIKSLSEGKVTFLAGGTGKPFFTTDTAATLRAIEVGCDAIFMAKNGVDGLYDDDPNKNPHAKFIKEITYNEILELKLQVMDLSAIELLLDKDIDIRIFSMSNFANFEKIAKGEDVGSVCKKGK